MFRRTLGPLSVCLLIACSGPGWRSVSLADAPQTAESFEAAHSDQAESQPSSQPTSAPTSQPTSQPTTQPSPDGPEP